MNAPECYASGTNDARFRQIPPMPALPALSHLLGRRAPPRADSGVGAPNRWLASHRPGRPAGAYVGVLRKPSWQPGIRLIGRTIQLRSGKEDPCTAARVSVSNLYLAETESLPNECARYCVWFWKCICGNLVFDPYVAFHAEYECCYDLIR